MEKEFVTVDTNNSKPHVIPVEYITDKHKEKAEDKKITPVHKTEPKYNPNPNTSDENNKQKNGQNDKDFKKIDEDFSKHLEDAEKKYKDTLKKLNTANSKRWESGLSKEEYHQAWQDYAKYKKELTKDRQEYAESIMKSFKEQDNSIYTSKINEKKEKYSNLSEKAKAESQKAFDRSSKMIDAIPLGQPIIEGHYSEKRERAYRQKAFDLVGKGIEEQRKSEYYANKSEKFGTSGISSDDKNAILKLAEKYKNGVTSAEKRRIIDRVIELHEKQKIASKPIETTNLGFSIKRNSDINRLQLQFDNIPDSNTRTLLKSSDFKWSPKEGVWQRQLTSNAEYSLKLLKEKLEKQTVKNSLYKHEFIDY